MSAGCSVIDDAPGGGSNGPRRPQADSVRPRTSARPAKMAARRTGRSERLTRTLLAPARHTTDRLRQARGDGARQIITSRVLLFGQPFQPLLGLALHVRRCSAAVADPAADRIFDRQD